MKISTRSAAAAVMMLALTVSPLVEAKRVGGGKNYGVSRAAPATSKSTSIAPAAVQQPSAQVQQKKGPGWAGVAAGVATGAVLGSVLSSNNANANNNGTANNNNGNGFDASTNSNQQQRPVQKDSGFPWFWTIVLAGGGYYLFRRFAAKKAATAVGGAPLTTNPNRFNQTPVVPSAHSAPAAPVSAVLDNSTLPDGTSTAAFLRQAKSTFTHMQTMNSSSNLEELRRYFTPEMYTAIQADIASNHDTADFPSLDAQIADAVQENGQNTVSVRYSGMVSESLNSPAVPFTETWHFVKPVGQPDAKWLVAGIQQQ